jgi:hypothetical protein
MVPTMENLVSQAGFNHQPDALVIVPPHKTAFVSPTGNT